MDGGKSDLVNGCWVLFSRPMYAGCDDVGIFEEIIEVVEVDDAEFGARSIS